MRRLLVLALVGAVLGVAFLLPAPPDPREPLTGLIIEPPGLASPEDAGIWYCPWAQSTALRDTVFGVVSLEEAQAAFTFPVTIPDEPDDAATIEVPGPGAANLALSLVAQRGDSPGFVELSAGPGAIAATVMGDAVLAADSCVASGPRTWHFPGGSTMPGEHLTLRLFNPFPDPAKVTVTGVSDIGVEALPELDNLAVAARSWRDVDFTTLLRQRQNLVITVSAAAGVVVPAMVFGTESDEDWWPGVGEASEWEFPVARVQGTDAYLVVHNPGLGPVEVVVDLMTPGGPVMEAFNASVAPSAPVRFDLSAYPGDPLAARLVSTGGPVAAAVVAKGEGGVAVMPGVPAASSTWLLPGLRRVPLHAASLWLLNAASEEAVSATVGVLGRDGSSGQTVVVPPGVPVQVDVTSADAAGILVEASGPVTVAWTIRGPSGLAFSAASPVAVDGE